MGDLVKTNTRKELAPYDEDWFFIRTASMARHMYIRSPLGVSTVKKIYGIRSNNGFHVTGPRVPGVSPGRLSRLWRDSSWLRRIPTVAAASLHRAGGIWTGSPPRSSWPLLRGRRLLLLPPK